MLRRKNELLINNVDSMVKNIRNKQSDANDKIYNRIREVENAAATKSDVSELKQSIEAQFTVAREERRERDNNMREFIKVTLENLKH